MITVTITERGKPPVKLDFDKTEITVGRVRGNDVVLQKNNVSKRHAKVVVKDGQFIIIDQKSTNGTIVNARKITAPQVVREGDTICIGDFILTLKHTEGDRERLPSGEIGVGKPPSQGGPPPPWLSQPATGAEEQAGPGPQPRPASVPSRPPMKAPPGLGPVPSPGGGRPVGPRPLGPAPVGPTPVGPAPAAAAVPVPVPLVPAPSGPMPAVPGPALAGPPPLSMAGVPGPHPGLAVPPPVLGSPPGGPAAGPPPMPVQAVPAPPSGSPVIGPLTPSPQVPTVPLIVGAGGVPAAGILPAAPLGAAPSKHFDADATPARGMIPPRPQGLPRPPREKAAAPSTGPGVSPLPFLAPAPPSRPELEDDLELDLGEQELALASPAHPPAMATPPRSTLAGFGPGPRLAEPQPGPATPAFEPVIALPPLIEEPPAPATGPMERHMLASPQEVPAGVTEEFEQVQAEAIRRVLGRVEIGTLPRNYPPSQSDLAQYERLVDRMLDSMAADRSLQGVQRKELMALLTYELVGLGPLELYLDDPTVQTVFVNSPSRIFINRGGQTLRGARVFSSSETLDLTVERLLASGQRIDEYFSTMRFADGTRVEILLPPLASSGPVVTLRKPPRQLRDLNGLVDAGILSKAMATFLTDATRARRTILVAGPDDAARTEILHAVAATLPDGQRIVTVEENAFLKLPQMSTVSLETGVLAGAGPNVIRYALRLDPDYLLVDSLGPHQAYEWIIGVAYRAMGSISTIPATGARDALARLESLAIPSTPWHSIRGIREQIGRAVHVVVVLSSATEPRGRVTQITEVQGLELDTLRLQELFYYQGSRDDPEGAFHPTGHIPAFYEELRRSGSETDLTIFRT